MNLNEAVVADRRRTAQGSMPGPRRAVAGVPPRFDEGVKVLVRETDKTIRALAQGKGDAS